MNKSTTSYVKSSIMLLTNSLEFFINNFRIFQGSNFYFNYAAADPCFMYYDLSNMKCLKAKEGYAVFKG